MFKDLNRYIHKLPQRDGLLQVDIIDFPPPLDATFSHIIRTGSITNTDFAAKLGVPAPQAAFLAGMLVEKGCLVSTTDDLTGEMSYNVKFTRRPRRKSSTDLFNKLDF